MDTLWTVDAARFVSKGRNTPLQGRKLLGRIRAVVADGVLDDREGVARG